MSTFIPALRASATPLIAEIKPWSPEHGDLLRGREALSIARDYLAAGAACLSVTTGRWHKGNLALLERIASQTDVPVLRKDFITRKAQLGESQAAGASAVLLSAQILRRQELTQLALSALEIGLTPFIEADSRAQLDDWLLPPGCVLAVCNRDIRQRETDDGTVGRSLDLYRAARACHPDLLVSASALRKPQDAGRAIESGFDAVLVGTALLFEGTVAANSASFIAALKC